MPKHLFSYCINTLCFRSPAMRPGNIHFLWLVIPGDTVRGVEKEEREGEDMNRASDPARDHCGQVEFDAAGRV